MTAQHDPETTVADLAAAEPPALDSTVPFAYARRAAVLAAGVVADYAVTTGGSEDDETTLTDLLTDLRHLADAAGLDFDAALAAGEARYAEEATGAA